MSSHSVFIFQCSFVFLWLFSFSMAGIRTFIPLWKLPYKGGQLFDLEMNMRRKRRVSAWMLMFLGSFMGPTWGSASYRGICRVWLISSCMLASLYSILKWSHLRTQLLGAGRGNLHFFLYALCIVFLSSAHALGLCRGILLASLQGSFYIVRLGNLPQSHSSLWKLQYWTQN